MIALIPARAGSKRVPGKNTRPLLGIPLIEYTLCAADVSNIFDEIAVCSDDQAALDVGKRWGATCLRREAVADNQPDLLWVRDALQKLGRPETFAILRPTSPFRTHDTIRRCYDVFKKMADCGDSVRAVKPVTEHPGKMWTYEGDGHPIRPLLNEWHEYHTETGFAKGLRVPWHSSPTQSLPKYYVQSSMIEMSWTANVEVHGTIHGRKVVPFFASELEQFSIDTEADWAEAEHLAREDPSRLPPIRVGAEKTAASAQ